MYGCNFPIAEIDKPIKVNDQALAINNSVKWRQDEMLRKLVFLLFKFESLLLKFLLFTFQI